MRKIVVLAVAVLLAACGAGNEEFASKESALGQTLAELDPVLRVPACASAVSECASGTLLTARGSYEPNAPNTLDGCADTLQWISGQDATVEAIRVRSLDGAPVQANTRATVEVDVITSPEPVYDRLFVFVAGDATAPSWTLVGQAGGGNVVRGAATHAFDVVLPAGVLPAIRASYHWTGSTTPLACDSTHEGDTDDLVFAVLPPAPDTVPPTVAITYPADGATLLWNASVRADASDNVGVQSVRFVLDGTTTIGLDPEAPFAVPWALAPVTPGPHTLTAEATDGAGNVTTSAPVSVTVLDSAFPYVHLVSPARDEIWRGVVPVTATATDNVGVVRAELWIALPAGTTHENTLVATLESPGTTFTIPWDTTGLPAGRYFFDVLACDAVGNCIFPLGSFIVVDNDPPIVSIDKVSPGAAKRGTVTLSATASDPYLSAVTFLVDGAPLATLTAAPFTATWTPERGSGMHVLSAVASDLAGNEATSTTTVRVK